jgi:hypothetical protein
MSATEMTASTVSAAMPIALALLVALALGACVHTPPGTSVEIAHARNPEIYRFPAPPKPAPKIAPVKTPKTAKTVKKSQSAHPSTGKHELTARAYARGEVAMKAGTDAEAIEAFEETVSLDPSSREAWQKLAILYERTGQEKKAMEAFRRAKQVAGD